jgi:diaminopimelate epimerase
MTGSGNDFVFLDGRETSPEDWPVERIGRVCARRTGVGADGLVILTPDGPSTIVMAFFNADGSRGAMCGNAALCSTRLASRIGLISGDEMELVTDAGTFATRCVGVASGHRAQLNLPDFDVPVSLSGIEPAPGERWQRGGAWFTTVGVPHLVVWVDDLEAVDLGIRGAELRSHAAVGRDGANANFVNKAASEGAGPASGWSMRTYERGVEGETLACGTGAVAVAATLALLGEAAMPVEIRTRSGRVLTVDLRINLSQVRDVWLGGEGRLVYQGEIESEE